MADFALIVSQVDKPDTEVKVNFFLRLIKWLQNIFKPKKQPAIFKMKLFEDLNGYVIDLPDLKTGMKKLNKVNYEYISKVKEDNDICAFITYEDSGGLNDLKTISKKKFSCKYLYRALIVDLLYEIYNHKGIDISQLDIVITQGTDNKALFAMISLLASYIKCITILSTTGEDISEEVNDIFEQTGLSIGISSNNMSCIKNANIIINLGGLEEIIATNHINSKAIIINYDNSEMNTYHNESVIINGLKFNLSHVLCDKINNLCYEFFTREELAEMIIISKMGALDKLDSIIYDPKLMKNLSNEFRKNNFSISGFMGRRNILSVKDIKVN